MVAELAAAGGVGVEPVAQTDRAADRAAAAEEEEEEQAGAVVLAEAGAAAEVQAVQGVACRSRTLYNCSSRNGGTQPNLCTRAYKSPWSRRARWQGYMTQ